MKEFVAGRLPDNSSRKTSQDKTPSSPELQGGLNASHYNEIVQGSGVSEAIAHLGLLGYKDGDRIYLRLIDSDGRAKKLEAVYPNLPELPTKQNVYFVVNGGGQRDGLVDLGRAIFYEHDNLEKSLQRDLWSSLGLPEPTVQIDTGGKSIHSYWLLKSPVAPDVWRTLQSDLLEVANADRSIKNPSRVMRLAGSIHQGTGQQATIITQSGQRYPFQELRAFIPVQGKQKRKQRPQKPVTVGVMPLTVVVAPRNRALIESGSAEGSRNGSGAALARDLIGCEGWLRASGIQYEGSAEGLFQDYCDRCNPPLPERERGTIWRSAVGDNPTPSLSVEKILGCIQAWERRESRPQVAPQNKEQIDKVEADFPSLLDALHKIFTESESAANQRWELIRLSKSQKIQVKDLIAIYDAWRDDQDDIEPMTLDQFKASVPSEREWLIASILPDRTTGIVHSDAGVGKTLLFYSFSKAIATGSPWNGYPTKQGKVLIVQTDEPSSETRDRFEVSGIFEGVPADQISILPRWGFSQIRKLERWMETHKPSFVVIDSLTTANRRNTSEEKDSPYGHCLSDLRDLADRYGCSIWVLHHSNRQGGLRGTTAIEANVSEVWKLRKPNQKEDLGKLDRILEVGKSRAGSTGNYHLRLDVDDYSWEWLGDKDSTAAAGNPSAELLSFMLLSPHLWFEPEELSLRGFGNSSRDAVRKQCERLKRKGLLDSEERVKNHEDYRGSTRYRVYRAVTQSRALDANQNTSSAHVQRSEPIISKDSLALDANSEGRKDSEKLSLDSEDEKITILSSHRASVQRSENQDIQALSALDVSTGHVKENVQCSEQAEVIIDADDF